MSQTHCPYCDETLVGELVTLWDQRTYCRRCVGSVSPQLLAAAQRGDSLVDVIPREAISFWKYWFLIARLIFQIAVTVITLCFVTVIIVFNSLFLAIAASLGMVASMLLLLAGMTYYPIRGYQVFRNDAPRLITVDHLGLRVIDGTGDWEIDLSRCTWREGESFDDKLACLAGFNRGILIQLPQDGYLVGFEERNVELFRAYLQLARIPRLPSSSNRDVMLRVGCYSFAGLFAGLLAGAIVALFTNDFRWQTNFALLGMLDGGFTALAFSRVRSEREERTKSFRRPLLMAIVFALSGLRTGLWAGWWPAITLAAINAALGLALAWLCIRKSVDPQCPVSP